MHGGEKAPGRKYQSDCGEEKDGGMAEAGLFRGMHRSWDYIVSCRFVDSNAACGNLQPLWFAILHSQASQASFSIPE